MALAEVKEESELDEEIKAKTNQVEAKMQERKKIQEAIEEASQTRSGAATGARAGGQLANTTGTGVGSEDTSM